MLNLFMFFHCKQHCWDNPDDLICTLKEGRQSCGQGSDNNHKLNYQLMHKSSQEQPGSVLVWCSSDPNVPSHFRGLTSPGEQVRSGYVGLDLRIDCII